ncbi:MAG: hypothetical protein JNJ45_04205 [Chthonomonas sp.]|nr:hypothetical protein [Chthonomonas sp.]
MPKWIWLPFIALIALWVWTVYSEPREESYPSVNSRQIDGLAAFGRLLEAEGYSVRVNHSPDDRSPDRKELLISTTYSGDITDLHRVLSLEGLTRLNLKELEVAQDYLVLAGGKPAFTVRGNSTSEFDPDGEALLRRGLDPWASVEIEGEAVAITLDDATIATNALIDKADNARVLMRLVKVLMPKPGPVVFDESGLVHSGQDLLSKIHPSASSIWNQALLLFGVIIFTFGRRFGSPIREVTTQKSTKSLLMAFGHLLRRASADRTANEIIYANLDAKIRARLNLAKDSPEEIRNSFLTDEQLRALEILKAAGNVPVSLENLTRALAIPSELARR